jgi:large subunit ribosomal protein L31
MKQGIHPESYRMVVFHDVSCGSKFLTRSTISTEKTTEFEGQEYPMVNIDISSASHPFYTGTQKLLDTEGRVERYYRKYGFKKPDADADVDAATTEDSADATETEDSAES